MNTQTLAACLKALSEPLRLRMLALLMERGELCVCELVDALGVSQSTISRHLAYLRNNSLVSARREGVWMHYRVAQELAPGLEPLLRQIRQLVTESGELRADLHTLEQSAGC